MALLKLQFFNAFDAKIDGESITNFGSNNTRALLVYIALQPEKTFSRKFLATLLWPHANPQTSKGNFRQTLYQLRTALKPAREKDNPFIHIIGRHSIQFNAHAPYRLDVADFLTAHKNESWQTACDSYTGSFLDGFHIDSPKLDRWFYLRRQALHTKAVEAHDQRVEQLLDTEKWEAAVAAAQREVALDSWREDAHQHLMLALAYCGERSLAIAQYKILSDVLDSAFNVQPNETSQRLLAKITEGVFEPEQPTVTFGPPDQQPTHDPHLEERDTIDALQSSFHLPIALLPPIAPLPPRSHMPLRRNPLFVGRTEDLHSLAESFNAERAMTISQAGTAAATGLGGIGKTQLAAEFVHRFGQYFEGGVFWLSFDKAEAISAEIAACGKAGALDLKSDFGELSLQDQVELVCAEWRKPIPRLLIFDNCEDPALLDQWRPTTGGCRVLVTSRRGDWEEVLGVKMLALGVLSRAESIKLLQSHRNNIPVNILDAIAEELGDLPLALHLAGCYLRLYKRSVKPSNYLKQLQNPKLLRHPSMRLNKGISPTGHTQNVWRTFALSYDQLDKVDERDALALRLLVNTAHFAPGEPIWYELLVKTLKLDNKPDAALQADTAFDRLIELGLIETEQISKADTESYILRMHRLVAKFVRDVAHDQVVETQQLVEEVVFDETARVNESGYPLPLLEKQSHLRAVVDISQTRNDLKSAKLCAELAHHLWNIGDFKGALPYAEKALEIRQALCGEESLESAESLCLLSNIYRSNANNVSRAEEYLKKALSIYKTLPDQNISIVTTTNLLGLWHMDHGAPIQALTYFTQALAGGKKIYQKNAPLIGRYENNVGAALRRLGRNEEALPHLHNALEINIANYGHNHREVGTNFSNIGLALYHLSRFADAQPYMKRAVEIFESTIGKQHPETILVSNNYASLLIHLEEYEEAEIILKIALQTLDSIFAKPHANTAFVLHNLGKLYIKSGRQHQAVPVLQRAHSIRQNLYGDTHPLTILSLKLLNNIT